MNVDGVAVQFVRCFENGVVLKAEEHDVDLLAKALVKYSGNDVAELIGKLVSDLDKSIDYMGFEKSECERLLIVYELKYVVVLPNGRVQEVLLTDFVSESEMPKQVYDKYQRIKGELMDVLEDEYKAVIDELTMNLDEFIAKFENILRKYQTVLKFLEERGLREDFLDFVKDLKKLDEEIEKEYGEFFDP